MLMLMRRNLHNFKILVVINMVVVIYDNYYMLFDTFHLFAQIVSHIFKSLSKFFNEKKVVIFKIIKN